MANTGISIKSGANLPIARWVYAVQDGSDVARMGGVSNNVYNTLTAAYAAADVIQTSLGGTNLVAIKFIGRLTGAAGNITLTANWNPRIALIGDGPDVSLIGNIVLNNAAGSGFSFGTAAVPVFVYNVRLGSSGISSNATGATGNGGEIAINSNGSFLGSVTSRVTNASNTAGSTGNIRVVDLYGLTVVGVVSNSLSVAGTTGNTGSLFLRAVGRMSVGGIENVGTELAGVVNGDLTLLNVDFSTVIRHVGVGVNIKNCTGGTIQLYATANIPFIIEDTRITDWFQFDGFGGNTLNLRNFKAGWDIDPTFGSTSPNAISSFKNVLMWNCYINNSYSLASPGSDPALFIDLCELILIKDCSINNIDDVNTQTGAALSVIQIDPSLVVSAKIIHTSIMGGALAIDSPAPLTVDTFSTYTQSPNGGSVTINSL